MTGKSGANLFTINFTSSSYYEEEEEIKKTPIKLPPQQPQKKAPPVKFTPTRITKQHITESPIGLELSDSSYYSSYDDYSKDANTTKTNQNKSTELDEDIFSIDGPDSNTDLQPTKIKKLTGNYHLASSSDHQIQTSDPNLQQSNEQEINPNADENNDNKNSNTNEHNENEINTNNSPELIQTKDSNQNSLPAIQTSSMSSPNKIRTNPGSWPIYLITREKKMQINGRRILFSFFEGSRQIYSAKCKGKNPHHVYIKRGDKPDSINNGDTADAIIMIGNEGTDFSLRKSSNSSNEIMTIRITPARTPADTARKLNVIFFEPRDGAPARLMSKNPCLNPDGKPEHDFEGRFAIDSVKNAVLVDKTKGPSLMFIRKTGKMAIEIEVRFEHEDLWIFAIGIASFLSKVK